MLLITGGCKLHHTMHKCLLQSASLLHFEAISGRIARSDAENGRWGGTGVAARGHFPGTQWIFYSTQKVHYIIPGQIHC